MFFWVTCVHLVLFHFMCFYEEIGFLRHINGPITRLVLLERETFIYLNGFWRRKDRVLGGFDSVKKTEVCPFLG